MYVRFDYSYMARMLLRTNVRPGGPDHIDAFMIGLVKPYFMGLMCSRRTNVAQPDN